MYNGRQNIQTESIHDQLLQNDPNMETKVEGRNASRTKFTSKENTKHLAEREIYRELNGSYLTRK